MTSSADARTSLEVPFVTDYVANAIVEVSNRNSSLSWSHTPKAQYRSVPFPQSASTPMAVGRVGSQQSDRLFCPAN